MTTNADLAMMRLAGLDAVDRGDVENARKMENTLRAIGRGDLADDIYAAGVSRGDTLRADLAAGADVAGGSAILAARVLAAAAHVSLGP